MQHLGLGNVAMIPINGKYEKCYLLRGIKGNSTITGIYINIEQKLHIASPKSNGNGNGNGNEYRYHWSSEPSENEKKLIKEYGLEKFIEFYRKKHH